jgi:hypothetical protein
MYKNIALSLLLIISGCKGARQDTWFTQEEASACFKRIEAACDSDNGKLYGKNLYGPLLLVERSTRKMYSDFPDEEGMLKEKGDIYSGTYPKELVINNNPVYVGGTLYALCPVPRVKDETKLITRALHGLMHYFQEVSGYTSSGYNTLKIDNKDARVWLKLEWKALRAALTSGENDKDIAIRDALVFRCSRNELYKADAIDEIRFENFEGLATFTSLLLSSTSDGEFIKRVLEQLDRIYSMDSYSRSYGGIHGALYATLLYQKGFNFGTVRSEDINLADKVRELYNVNLPGVCRDVAGSLALNYDIGSIIAEETKRESDLREKIHRRVSTFTEKPVIFLELESPYFDFEPEDIHPMDTLGTLYSSIRVSDNWGKLVVDKGGCLVSPGVSFMRVTARGLRSGKQHVEGDGWNLSLREGWEILPVGQNFIVRNTIH